MHSENVAIISINLIRVLDITLPDRLRLKAVQTFAQMFASENICTDLQRETFPSSREYSRK